MFLKLGSITTVVVSSPKFAKEILQKHDSSFSDRTPVDAGEILDHNNHSIVFLPAGTRWKKLRKLCKEQIFASHQLDASEGLRKRVVADLLDYAHECCSRGEAMDIGRAGHTTSLNLLSNFLFSIDLARHDSTSSHEFKEIVLTLLELRGKPNFADYFPMLKRFDPQGIRLTVGDLFAKAIYDLMGSWISGYKKEMPRSMLLGTMLWIPELVAAEYTEFNLALLTK